MLLPPLYRIFTILLLLGPLTTYASDVSGVVTQASNNDCNNGAINLIITGGKAPYSIEWTGPNGFHSLEEDIYGLKPGTYYVSIYDNNCCFVELNFEVTCSVCNSQIVLDKLTDAFCDGKGAIDIRVTNAPQSGILFKWYNLSPLSQTWSLINQSTAGANGGDLANTAAGKYKVEVSFGPCKLEKQFEVTNTGQIQSAITIIKQVTECTPVPQAFPGFYTSSNDGAICVTLLGTVPPHTIKWFKGGIAFGEGNCFNNLGPGKYSFKADFGNGCIVDLGEKVLCCCGNPTTNASHPNIPFCSNTSDGNPTGADIFIGNINIRSSTSAQSNDGSISFTVSPASLSYNYQWSPTQTGTNSLTNLGPGTYCVTVSEPCKGKSATKCFTLRNCETAEMTLSGVVTNTCPGYAYGKVSTIATGAGAPFTFKWNTGATTSTINFLSPGTYCVTASAQDGCTRERCFNVTSQQSFVPSGVYNCGTNYSCNGNYAYSQDYNGPLNCGYENCNLWTCRCPLTGGILTQIDHGFAYQPSLNWDECSYNLACRDGGSVSIAGSTRTEIIAEINGIVCLSYIYCEMLGEEYVVDIFQNSNPMCYPFASDERDFTHSKITDYNNIFSTYPNPFNENISFEPNSIVRIKDENLEIQLTNTLGTIVMRQRVMLNEPSEINTNDLPEGMYLITLRKDGKAVFSKKLIKSVKSN